MHSRFTLACLTLALAGGGCSDALEQNTATGQSVAVLNATSLSVTFVDATDYTTETVSLAGAGNTPSRLAARRSLVVVPLGGSDAVQVLTPLGLGASISLAGGARPTGAVLESDSVAWITEPGRNAVVRVHVDSGAGSEMATGPDPAGVLFPEPGLLYVLNTHAGPTPQPPGSISWFRMAGGPQAAGTITLTGANPSYATVDSEGLVYVVDAGDLGSGNGRLSIIDPITHTEVAVLNGLGESPGPVVYHPSGRLLIASVAEGILEVNTARRELVRGPGTGVMPAGDGVSALAVDPRGRVYAAAPRGCVGPGVVHVLTAPPDYRVLETIPVGVCPTAEVLVGLSPVE